MKIQSMSLVVIEMSGSDIKKIRLYFIFLWGALGLLAVSSPFFYLYSDAVNSSVFLKVVVLVVMIPVGMMYLTLWGDCVKMYGLKLLILAPVLFFPAVALVIVSVGPFFHLAYMTYKARDILFGNSE